MPGFWEKRFKTLDKRPHPQTYFKETAFSRFGEWFYKKALEPVGGKLGFSVVVGGVAASILGVALLVSKTSLEAPNFERVVKIASSRASNFLWGKHEEAAPSGYEGLRFSSGGEDETGKPAKTYIWGLGGRYLAPEEAPSVSVPPAENQSAPVSSVGTDPAQGQAKKEDAPAKKQDSSPSNPSRPTKRHLSKALTHAPQARM